MSSTFRRFIWIGAALAVIVVVVAAIVVFVVPGDDSESPRIPITEPKQGFLQTDDFPGGYKIETAGTETGSPADSPNLTPSGCLQAVSAQNRANAKKSGNVQFAEPPKPDMPRYQQTVYRDGADLAAIRESARACPTSVDTADEVTATTTNTLLETPAGCPDGTVVVQTRSVVKVAGTLARDFITASAQNGRFVTQVAQEWTAPGKPDIDELCRLTSIALKRLTTTAEAVASLSSSTPPPASEFCRYLTADDVATVFADTSSSRDLTYRDDVPKSSTTPQQCSWLLNMNTLDMQVENSSGEPSTLTLADPVDVGGGVSFYRSKYDLDGTCSGEFHATSQPDKDLTVSALPLTVAGAPSKPVEPLCTALIAAGTKVVRALGWTR